MQDRTDIEVKIFSSFEEENACEYKRRKKMSVEERCREFAVLQAQRWGADWFIKPIVKKVTYEKLFLFPPNDI